MGKSSFPLPTFRYFLLQLDDRSVTEELRVTCILKNVQQAKKNQSLPCLKHFRMLLNQPDLFFEANLSVAL